MTKLANGSPTGRGTFDLLLSALNRQSDVELVYGLRKMDEQYLRKALIKSFISVFVTKAIGKVANIDIIVRLIAVIFSRFHTYSVP